MTETIEKTITKSAKISFIERSKLERKCRNKLNWDDAGNWNGSGKEPNCFIRENIKNSISHTYRFPTDEIATKWNLEWEKYIRYAGHLGTTALTVAVSTGIGGIAAITVGTLAAITKDEVQASISYPRMARGWSYELIFEHDFKWSPHPWGQRVLIQKITTISRDFDDKVIRNISTIRKYSLAELPDGLGRLLASKPSKKTISDYK